MEDSSISIILSGLERLSKQLDDMKDEAADAAAITSARLATLDEWRRSTDFTVTDLGLRVRSLEQDRVTQARILILQGEVNAIKENSAGNKRVDDLAKEVTVLREERAAGRLRDRMLAVIGAAAVSGLVSGIIHYFGAAHP